MASFLPTYTADGSATKTGINIKTFKKEDIKVYVDDDLKTAGIGTTAGSSHDYEIQSYTTSSFNIGWVANKEPTSPSKVRIVRDTVILKADNSDVEGKAVFTAGSSVKAGDLNANQNQALRALEELDDQKIQKYDIDADAVTTTEIRDNTIVNANISTTAAIAGTKVAPDFGSQNIVTTGTASSGNLGVTGNITVSGTVDGRDVATDGSKLDGIETGATADQTSSDIKTLLASDNLTDAHLAANSVGNSELKSESVNSDQYVDGSIDEVHLNNNIISNAKIIDGAVIEAKIGTGAVTTDKIANGSINEVHLNDNIIGNAKIINGAVIETKIGTNAVTTDKIADNNVNDDKLSHTAVTPGSYGTTTSIPTIVVNAQGRVTSASGNTIDTNLVADTSPQLGGNLDVQTREITTSGTNQDITLTPTGSGTVTVKGTGTQSGTLELNTENNALSVKIQAPTNTNLDASDDSYTLVLPVNNGDAGQFLKTDGLGVLSWDTVSGGGGGGGTAAPNSIVALTESVDGNRTDFSMSVTPASAQNLIVSVNGVVQKPNAGTTIAGSAEGYCVDGSTLKFATAPANGSSIFIIEHAATTASDRIVEGNSNVDVFDDNSTSRAVVNLDGAEKFRINEGGQIGLGGANYGTDGQVLTSQGSGAAAQWESIPSSDLVNDTSPQLGGNLDVLNREITTSQTNQNVTLTPNGTGVAEIKGAGGNDGTLQLNCSQNSHGVKIKSPAHSAGASYTLTLPTTDGNANQVLKTDGSGVLAWVDQTTDTNTTELSSDTSPQLGGTLASNTHDIHMADNDKLFIGTGQDMHIFHDGTNSFITSNNGYLQINAGYNEIGVKLIPNGATELYYDNTLKAHTYSAGFKVDGIQRNVAAGYNYLLVGSNDASGVSIGLDGDSNGDGVGGDYAYIEHGSDGDLSIVCDNPAGDSQFELYVGNGTKTAIIAQAAGETQLYYDGSIKFNTISAGAKVTGKLGIGTASPSDELTIYGSDPVISLQEASVSSKVDIGTGTVTGYINIQKADGTRNVQISADGTSYFNSGNVGIGTTTPTSYNGDANSLVLYESGVNTGMTIATTGSNNCNIFFADSDVDGAAEYAGYVQYSHASDELRLGAASNNRLEVRQNEVEVVDGDLVIGTSGHGIQFDVNGSGSDQLLDDYEEGSWTPTLNGGGSSVTYLQQYGRYVKIGKMVTLSCRLQFTATGNNSALAVGGIPFTVISGTGENYTSGGITYCDVSLNFKEFDPYLNSTNTQVTFYQKGSGNTIKFYGTGQQVNKYLGFSAVYFA